MQKRSGSLLFLAGGLVIIAVGFFWLSRSGSPDLPDTVQTADQPDPQAASQAPRPAPSAATAKTAGPSGAPAQAPATTAAQTTGSSTTMPLPEPVHHPKWPPQQRVELWQVDAADPDTTVDGIPATKMTVEPELLSSMHVGQEVTLPIPALNRSVTATLTSTHNQINNVEVFKGPITDGNDKDNVIITRGKTNTHVIVATREGVFSATIDNRTGSATLTDEGDINGRIDTGDDTMTVPGIEMPVPEAS
ncbi:hypothetical protein [Marinobacter sp. V034]|uniref:hypothetical protein n=1 Tax=Marinobacter sp. V034 TaxID=3459610 RepID=UPI00404502B5